VSGQRIPDVEKADFVVRRRPHRRAIPDSHHPMKMK
jgi:hypothetical protein